jgi:putative tricarboxylic transport membrane protein
MEAGTVMSTRVRWTRRVAPLVAALAILACGYAAAAEWRPDKRVEIVVPSAPGGGNDRIVRLVIKISQESRLVDAIMNVVHKPGAGVVMGLTYLNQHPGDGNYIGIISATFMGDYVTGRSTFGPGDITPIAQLFSESVAFAVKPDSSIKSGQDLLARLKADSASISTAIAGGVGNHNHIALALVTRAAGGDVRKLKIVRFNGGAESITAALGGHVDMVVTPARPRCRTCRRGGCASSPSPRPRRLQGALAAVPVWKELGANAVLSNWRTIVGPRGMTQPQVAFWESVLARVVENDEWKQMLERDSLDSDFLKSAQTRAQLKAEQEELKAVMGELGLAR